MAIVVCAFMTFLLSYVFRIIQVKREFLYEATVKIEQIQDRVQINNETIETMKADLKLDYISKAGVIAKAISQDPELIYDYVTLIEYMELLYIDEIHFFDQTGTIFTGTVPEYIGFSFESGEQMAFFKPMLYDENLALAQDLVPNTADGSLMQYATVWNDTKDIIVQVGHQPEHLIETLKDTDLSYVLPLLITDTKHDFVVFDNETGEIHAASNHGVLDKNISKIISMPNELGELEDKNGTYHYYSENFENLVIAIGINESDLYADVFNTIFFNAMAIVAVAAAVVLMIVFSISTSFINPVYKLIDGLNKITEGDLDVKINIDKTPEFISLSSSINEMVAELTDNSKRINEIFQNVTVPIALFVAQREQNRVKPIGKLGEILHIDPIETKQILQNGKVFKEHLSKILNKPTEQDGDIFLIESDGRPYYVKVKLFDEFGKFWGLVIDVTDEVYKQETLRSQRDIDNLTMLYSRWGFKERMNRLFYTSKEINEAVVVMLDLDNLKFINDNYGHDYGDKLLITAASVLSSCSAPNMIASRLGGDEFVLVIHNADNRKELEGYIEELREHIAQAFVSLPNKKKLPISFSGGYVFYDKKYVDYDMMVTLADKAMYKVKKSGKGRIEEYVE